jgi:hypothetical protein
MIGVAGVVGEGEVEEEDGVVVAVVDSDQMIETRNERGLRRKKLVCHLLFPVRHKGIYPMILQHIASAHNIISVHASYRNNKNLNIYRRSFLCNS